MLWKIFVVSLMLYMGCMLYMQRNAIDWLNSQMAEKAKVEALWEEAIKRCLAD